MWQSPGSSPVQRPTSLVWVERVATRCSISARCTRQKSANAAADVTVGRGCVGDAAHEGHRVVVGGERVLGPREEQPVHGGQEEQGAPLGERRAVEEGQDVGIVGDAPADGGVGAAAVALDRGGERPEVARERLVDEHELLRSWRGATG